MANSTHTLKLRAVLDASDVQSKLAQVQQAGQMGGYSQVGASAESLSQSLDKLEKSSKKAGDTLDKMGKVGALIAAGHMVSNFLGKSGYSSSEDQAYLNMTMRGMQLGGMLKGKKGALIGGGMGLMEAMLMNIMNDDTAFGNIQEKFKALPLLGDALSEALEGVREVVLTFSGEKARQEAEEQERLNARLEHLQSANDYFKEAKKSWEMEQQIAGMSKAGPDTLRNAIARQDELKKKLADLFDPESEERKKFSQYGGDSMIKLANVIQETKKELAAAGTLAGAARSEQERRFDKYWEQPFGPMTNFAKMGIYFGENANGLDNRIVHNQEQGLELVRQIRDKINRGESNFATYQ